MKRWLHALILPVAFLAASARGWEPDDFASRSPSHYSSLSGVMLGNESEFLTPAGIVDDIPLETFIEPSAGPEPVEEVSGTSLLAPGS